MKKYFESYIRKPGQYSSLHRIRAHLLNVLLFSSLVVGTILFPIVVIPAVQKGLNVVILAYIILYIWTVLITFNLHIPYRVRVFGWLLLFYAFGMVNLAMNGFNVDAGLFFVTLIAMAALFDGLRSGIIALGVTSLTISAAGFIFINWSIKPSMGLDQWNPLLWIIGGVVFFLMGIFLILSLTTLVVGLDTNLHKSTILANDLAMANETLQKSEERFRSLIEGSTDIIGILTRDGTIRYASPSVERILGYTPDELVGQNILQFIHPDSLPIAQASLFTDTPAELIGPTSEIRFLHSDGTWRYLEIKGTEMYTNPAIDGVIINCRDITDRKDVEEKLRKSHLLLEKTFTSLNDALFLIDGATKQIIDCNLAASKTFGYCREEMIGQSTGFLFEDASDGHEFDGRLDLALEDVDRSCRYESRMKRADGKAFPVDYNIAALVDSQIGHIGWVSLVHDDTIRKQAERSLLKARDDLEQKVAERTAEVQRTSQQLRELVAHSPAVIYSAHLNDYFTISFVSENVVALTGYEATQFVEDLDFWRSHVHPEDVQKVFAEIESAQESGGGVFEYRFLHKDGEYCCIRDEMKRVNDLDGNQLELVGSWIDVTDQKKAEYALRESEKTNRVILNATDASLSMIDSDGVVLTMNDAGAQLLGRSPEEIIGHRIYDFFPPDLIESRKAINDSTFRSGQPVQYEDFRQGYWFDNKIFPVFDERGQVTRLVIHANNITERKKVEKSLIQSEERYRTLAEASPDMIFIIGNDDRVQYVNSYAAAFLKLPQARIVGQPRERFFSADTGSRQKNNILNTLNTGKITYAEEPNIIGDQAIWLGSWLVPLRDASGNISAVLGISRDISAQKNAEIEIKRSRDLLEKRVEERTSELIASQTQLRRLTSQLVNSLEEERRRISRELHDEAGQALITLKYDLATIAAELPEEHNPDREHLLDLITIIDRLMTQMRTLAHSLRPPVLEIGGINLSLKDYCEEFTERTGLSIRYRGVEIPGLTDEVGISLYRFVQEMLTNILKHANATKVDVNLQFRKKQISLTVSDNGRGMDAATRSDGIGLLGVRERFSLLGGVLDLQSRKGRGVKATVSVPWPKPVVEEQS